MSVLNGFKNEPPRACLQGAQTMAQTIKKIVCAPWRQAFGSSFLKLFKTLTARVLSSLKVLALCAQIFKLDLI